MEFNLENKLSFKNEAVVPTNGENQIFIFCTSLRNGSDVQKITPLLSNVREIISWTVDLEDCDKVLRVVCRQGLSPHFLEDLFLPFGVWIEEMIDG